MYGLEVSRGEYMAFTTEQSEKVRVKDAVFANGGNYDLGLRSVLAAEEEARLLAAG